MYEHERQHLKLLSTSTLTFRICTLIRENSCCKVWGSPSWSAFFSSRTLLGGSSFKTSRRQKFSCWISFWKMSQRAVLGYLLHSEMYRGAPHLTCQFGLLPSSSPWLELCWGSTSWVWRGFSGSGRREMLSMNSSTPSNMSFAQSCNKRWKI